MTDDVCGYEETTTGQPCRHPTPNGICPVPSHNGATPDGGNPQGRKRLLDDADRRKALLAAVGSGLNVRDQAGMAGVHPDTLRRALCCVNSPRDPTLIAEEPCEFCDDYVRAHAQGAFAVLKECRPEFRAAATFGYHEKHEVEHSGTAAVINLPESVTDRWQRVNEP